MRRIVFHRLGFLLALFALGPAYAQGASQPPVQESAPAEGRQNQRVEMIHVEDSGAVIDEVRYAGQTQSIKVQPKAGVPGYEIEPSAVARGRTGENRDGTGTGAGQRVWNVLNF